MTPRAAGATLVTVLAIMLADAPACAADEDPWLGEDKALHFGVSAGIAGGGYVAGALLFDRRAHALATGAALAVALGVSKEVYDLAGNGNASWKDLAWDGLGMVTGLALFWGIDLALRGVSTRQPPFAVARGRIAF